MHQYGWFLGGWCPYIARRCMFSTCLVCSVVKPVTCAILSMHAYSNAKRTNKAYTLVRLLGSTSYCLQREQGNTDAVSHFTICMASTKGWHFRSSVMVTPRSLALETTSMPHLPYIYTMQVWGDSSRNMVSSPWSCYTSDKRWLSDRPDHHFCQGEAVTYRTTTGGSGPAGPVFSPLQKKKKPTQTKHCTECYTCI